MAQIGVKVIIMPVEGRFQEARLMDMTARPIINISRKQDFRLHWRACGINIEACMQNANHKRCLNSQLTLGSFT